MPETSPEVTSRRYYEYYQFVFNSALEAYEGKTGTDLTNDPLFLRFETYFERGYLSLANLRVD
jgi:hypothetical protein